MIRRTLQGFWLAGVLLLAAGTVPLSAQVVRGTLLEEGTDRPVTGTLVTLRPELGGDPVGTLTDDFGRFSLVAPGPGSYTVRAERIGFATTNLPPLRLDAGETRDLVLRVASAPVVLEGIGTVAARRQRCSLRPEAGSEAAILWNEARKALVTAEWTEREGAFLFEHALYENRLEPRTLEVTNSTRRTERVRSTFHTLPVDRLLNEGFVQRSDSVTEYYGPDAAVLLSERFLEQHCLRVRESADDSDALVGLAFEPVRRSGGIRGTLWLERSTAELRHLEFTYPNPPVRVSSDDIGGRVEFARLPTGEWIIRRWWIRTPRVAIERSHTPVGQPIDRAVLEGLNEHGGEVLGVYTRTGRPLYAALASTLRTMNAPDLLTQRPPARSAEAAPAPVSRQIEETREPDRRQRSRARANPSVITLAEITGAGGANAFDVVQSLRPQWLRTRGQTTLRTSGVADPRGGSYQAMTQVPIMVYVEGQQVGGLEALRGLSTSQIRELRFVDSREAVQRWGSDHGNGAVMVLLRR